MLLIGKPPYLVLFGPLKFYKILLDRRGQRVVEARARGPDDCLRDLHPGPSPNWTGSHINGGRSWPPLMNDGDTPVFLSRALQLPALASIQLHMGGAYTYMIGLLLEYLHLGTPH